MFFTKLTVKGNKSKYGALDIEKMSTKIFLNTMKKKNNRPINKEDQEDLAIISQRAKEPTVSHEDLLKKL